LSPVDDVTARRNARVLACAQALGGASPAIVVSLGGLVGQAIATDKALATLPVSILQLGLAFGTVPAAMLMRRLGRRSGYFVGASFGVLAGCVAALGTAWSAFALFCAGTFLAGIYGSFVQSYRFAATDMASEEFRPRAISWVMAGGLAAGIIGPQLVIWTRDLLDVPFAGAFLGQGALALASMAILSQLRSSKPAPASSSGGRPLGELARQPRLLMAITTGIVSYGLMSFLMTAAPIAMVGCGHSVGAAALGIQWHILAMYGPSFVTGSLISRFGKEAITASGLILIALAAATGLAGISVTHFWSGLILLGFGWNFAFIGSTSLVTECYRPEERTRVQALNDFCVFGSVAIASFTSGTLMAASGWELLNWLVFPPIAGALMLLYWQSRIRSRSVRLSRA
jgi:predicted MFS family arabinose efflux permease